MKLILTSFLLCLPLILIGQLKIEGIYPFKNYNSGQVVLILSNGPHIGALGYTSFQVIDDKGDTVTNKTSPSYTLPRSTTLTYKLELKEGVEKLPDNFCGTLILENPDEEIDFCLDNLMQSGGGGETKCDKYELGGLYYAAEPWNDEVSILLTVKNDYKGGFTGYTSFQLYNDAGDSVTYSTGPNYFLPVMPTDTFVYNLKLLESVLTDPLNIDSSCFELRTEAPDCVINYCKSLTNVVDPQKDRVIAYPNPFSNKMWINASLVERVEIIGLNGELLLRQNGNLNSIDGSGLAQGVYILRVYQKQGITIQKVIKM